MKRPSSTGYGENGFLDLRHSEMPDHIQVDMRQIREFVCSDNGINDCRAIDSEGLGERRFQFARLLGCKTMTATGARQSCKVGIRKFDAFPEWRQAHAGVENEYRIGLSEITNRPGYRLRMDAILTARDVGLLIY